MGALDSFALVDFVTVLEQETGISVPDGDVNPANFQSIEQIERYVESKR
jgi:acyl carrier protein